MFNKILVANRGEIAVRIIRACQELGIATVLAHSEADRHSLAAALADETICIGPGRADRSYLHIPNVTTAALVTGADALHPGYGFLAENPDMADICERCGITFIGPPADVIATFGNKVRARALMRQAGLPVLPGSDEPLRTAEAAIEVAEEIGYPVMLKAVSGGGGRGMRVARDSAELADVFPLAQEEAKNSFGDGSLYVELLVPNARHVEVQLVADKFGSVIHLGERDCSIQRRHQKLLEEAPSPAMSPDMRSEMGRLAVTGARAVNFQNVGTMEFLLAQDGTFYFIETNCRIQVEHPVTEMVTGIDLVKEQIRLAAGEHLNLRQEDIRVSGHAIECRINAEDVEKGFAPSTGVVSECHFPGGPGIRVDSHVFSGYSKPPYYDSLLAKVISWGRDREEAIDRMSRALRECRIEGLATNIPLHQALLAEPRFREGRTDTSMIASFVAKMMSTNGGGGLGAPSPVEKASI